MNDKGTKKKVRGGWENQPALKSQSLVTSSPTRAKATTADVLKGPVRGNHQFILPR